MSERQPPDVGAQVKALRTERGLSMRALAERCDLSPNTISLIERTGRSFPYSSPCRMSPRRVAQSIRTSNGDSTRTWRTLRLSQTDS